MTLAFRIAPYAVMFAALIWAVPVLDAGWSFLLGMAVGMFSIICHIGRQREIDLRRWH